MDYKKELEELQKKIDNNAIKIIENFNHINNNTSKIEKNSYALDILKDYKTETKRLWIVLLIVLSMWFITIGVVIIGKFL